MTLLTFCPHLRAVAARTSKHARWAASTTSFAFAFALQIQALSRKRDSQSLSCCHDSMVV
jgi:hypothetical protein